MQYIVLIADMSNIDDIINKSSILMEAYQNMRRKGQHLTLSDRYYIEKLHRLNYSKKEIAEIVGCCLRTVYYELKRATYKHTLYDLSEEERYSPEESYRKYRENLSKKGRKPKIIDDPKLAKYISFMITEMKYSPARIIDEINNNDALSFKVKIKSPNTIYKAIKNGNIYGVKLSNLPRGKRKRKKRKVKTAKRSPVEKSIERRPEEIALRGYPGHWEMDTVKSGNEKGKCLLVLTERYTRIEIIEIMAACNMDEVRKALNRIERRVGSIFYGTFISITVDNGSEFKSYQTMEKALYRVGNRTKIFYCHPYSSHERGSNENANLLIRRWLPKGSSFDHLTRRDVKEIEYWINSYPRGIFNGLSSIDIAKQKGFYIPDG